jgi:hypothetical protein
VADITWDDAATEEFLRDVVLSHFPELAEEVAHAAYALAPVRTRRTAVPRWAKQGYVGMPGHLKASVDWSMGEDLLGVYAEVGSLWYGRFMDPKARQLHAKRPFLPSALEWTLDGRVYHWD